MTNAQLILTILDGLLNTRVELTLYGRAALSLGFPEWQKQEFLQSRDIDVIFWIGQAEELDEKTNFWQAVEETNQQLAERGLYISHFFTEDQVVLTPEWRGRRMPLGKNWRHLDLYRLGNMDLLLSKLMRNDPLDQNDALFLAHAANVSQEEIKKAVANARIPSIREIQEQFNMAARIFLERFAGPT
jgi:hypothetical protein